MSQSTPQASQQLTATERLALATVFRFAKRGMLGVAARSEIAIAHVACERLGLLPPPHDPA